MKKKIIILVITLLVIILFIYFAIFYNKDKISTKMNNNKLNDEISNLFNTKEKYDMTLSSYVKNYVIKPEKTFEKDVTIIIKTFLRPKCLLRLLFGIRNKYSYVRIIIADDSLNKILKEGENSLNIYCIYLPFNIGVSKGRNDCVDMVRTKYLILLDDDMIVSKNTNFELFYDTIEKYQNEIDLLAGTVLDRGSYDALFEVYTQQKTVNILENAILYKKNEITWSHRQLNFFICKTQLLKDVPWDNNLKTEEHTEHFYRIYLSGYKVANTTKVEIDHNNDCNESYIYTLFRNKFFFTYILNKYNLQKFGDSIKSKKQTTFENTLLDARKSLKKYNIDFALSCGTALGYYREKQFIDHDNDIDLIIFRKDINSENEIINAMSNYFTLVIKRGILNNGLEYTFKHNITKVLLDIFIMYETNNFYWYACYEGKNYDTQVRLKYPKIDFKEVYFLNENFKIVPQEYLNVDYGDSWLLYQKLSYEDMMSNNFSFRWNFEPSLSDYENDCPVPVLTDNFITDYFKDNVWYINLDKRKDRNENVIKQFDRLNIRTRRFSAIDAENNEIVNMEFNKKNTKLSKREIACTLSHRYIWEYIVQNKIPWTLIFEDDIYIPEEITQKQFGEGMIESICGKRNPQIIFFGACLDKNNYLFPHNKFFTIKVTNTKPNCMHAYAITWRMAEKLLKNNTINDIPIDTKICEEVCNQNLCTLVSPLFKIKNEEDYFGSGIVRQNRYKYKSDLRKI
jgi:GR25 family glycosyltransferase involved in LPS biosynthesis